MTVVNVAVIIHAVRTPPSRWATADREKVFWVGLLVLTAVLPPIGLVISAVYGLAIAPRLSGDSSVRRFSKE